MRILWRRAALYDLASIHDFIAHDNPEAATRVAAEIRATVDPLGTYQSFGRAGRVDGTRERVVADLPYIVAYRVAQDSVRILAVIHTSRQWPRRF